MTTIRLPVLSRLNRWLSWAAWAALFPAGWILIDVLILTAGAPGPAHPGGWTWMAVALLNLGYLGATAYTARFVLGPFLVSVSEAGLEAVTLRGVRRLDWSSIEDVRVSGPLVTLRAGPHQILLNKYCYVNPDALIQFLSRVLPRSLQSRVAV